MGRAARGALQRSFGKHARYDISLASGARTTLIPQPIKGGAYGFHDVRCSETVYAWIEMNYAEASWVLLAQELQNGALAGEAVELDHGNADWEPARFTVAGGHVIWREDAACQRFQACGVLSLL